MNKRVDPNREKKSIRPFITFIFIRSHCFMTRNTNGQVKDTEKISSTPQVKVITRVYELQLLKTLLLTQ